MPVNPVRAVTRALAVLEGVGEHAPIGVADLARLLEEDVSAVQQALVSLDDAEWIQRTSEQPVRWELTLRAYAVGAQAAHRSGLRTRSRPVLEALRDETGETAFLVEVDDVRLVVTLIAESHQVIRAVPRLGLRIPAEGSASAAAVLAYLHDDARQVLLGRPVDGALRRTLGAVARRGWSVSAGLVSADQTALAAAVRQTDGRPIGAVTLTGPRARITVVDQRRYGPMIRAAAVQLSTV